MELTNKNSSIKEELSLAKEFGMDIHNNNDQLPELQSVSDTLPMAAMVSDEASTITQDTEDTSTLSSRGDNNGNEIEPGSLLGNDILHSTDPTLNINNNKLLKRMDQPSGFAKNQIDPDLNQYSHLESSGYKGNRRGILAIPRESGASLWCHECGMKFANGQLFYDHLKKQERSKAGSLVRICGARKCSFPCMSSCAMTFHTRLWHQEFKPFFCSDCGWNNEMKEQNWQLLHQHLSGTCFQSSKVALYRCKVISYPGYDVTACNFQCESFKKLASHYGSAHVNIVYTCNVCDKEFSNKYLWFKHLFNVHKNNQADFIEANASLSSQLKCECCSKVLNQNAKSLVPHLLSKLHQHCDSRIVYKCSACYHLFGTCDGLKRHKEEDCLGQSNGTESFVSSSPESEEELEKEPKSKKRVSLENRNEGRRQFVTWKSEARREQISPFNSLSASDLILLSWNNLQERLGRDKNKSESLISQHTFNAASGSGSINSKKIQEQIGPKRLHAKNEMKEALNMDQISEIVWQSIARLPNATFKCVKCSEVLLTEDSFYSHIRTEHVWKELEVRRSTHADVDLDSYCCFECDAKFITKQTLKRHVSLHNIFHQNASYLKNADHYLDLVGYGNWKLPLKTNQCEVCFVVCDDTLDYETHIKSHGI